MSEIHCGFSKITTISTDFRAPVLRKGKELLDSEHVYDLIETKRDGIEIISANVKPQTSVSAASYKVEIGVSSF